MLANGRDAKRSKGQGFFENIAQAIDFGHGVVVDRGDSDHSWDRCNLHLFTKSMGVHVSVTDAEACRTSDFDDSSGVEGGVNHGNR